MSKQIYLVKYNNCHGQGYWNDIEGVVEGENEFDFITI